ncbi:MAG: agmatinase [Candidatus Scalindua sp. AMX11]|nr:MAG: agmatinase [Candidatus Scalindua sp.]NOG82596.1 agmatinase [Planctomycetota bacterium]RZV78328.1 MAG: agmatinase [Candidatus Scalindua sp. SCAELEC01]TDE65123.1 MAG: agmatinase [Candidatus Scalindua sp. AMX11]GJQ59528.1 MAG: agmatinase [Candidatus Scalindua sp.]
MNTISKYIQSSSPFGAFKCNFKDEAEAYSASKVVVVGVPYDGTTTFQPGTRNGPTSILHASPNLEHYDRELGNIFEIGIYTAGIVDIEEIHVNPSDVINRVYEVSKKFVSDGKFLVTIGGEHSVTQGIVRAYKEKYRNLSVLQLDAHHDLMETYGGSKYSHASVSKRLIDLKCRLTQFGIRVTSEEEHNFIRKEAHGLRIFYAKDIYDNARWHEEAIESLHDDVYLTIDLDGLDPSIMPATGTPVPGGLGWYETLNFLKKVYEARRVVGLDLMELQPIPGDESPNFLAADLIYKNIGFLKKYLKR